MNAWDLLIDFFVVPESSDSDIWAMDPVADTISCEFVPRVNLGIRWRRGFREVDRKLAQLYQNPRLTKDLTLMLLKCIYILGINLVDQQSY